MAKPTHWRGARICVGAEHRQLARGIFESEGWKSLPSKVGRARNRAIGKLMLRALMADKGSVALTSFRDVEDLLAERGVNVSFQTVSKWAAKFGLKFSHELRRRSRGHFADKWQLDEMVVTIKGKKYWLWRAFGACVSACKIGSDAVLVVRGLSGANDAGLKEVDFPSAVHLAFYKLELGNLPLRLSIRPGRTDRGTHGCPVFGYTVGEGRDQA